MNSSDSVTLRNYIYSLATVTIPVGFLDVNGDGLVNVTDLTLVTARNGKKLP